MAGRFSLRSPFVWAALILGLCCGISSAALANNPGDPLFCQPNEGNSFLIVNGGAGVFTIDPDCFGNNTASNPNPSVIHTTQGGTLTLSNTPRGSNYVYTPPTSGFVGLDTFSVTVTTSWNSTGGTGSNNGTNRAYPGDASVDNITLNVLSSTATLQDQKNTAMLLPIPSGSISGCGP